MFQGQIEAGGEAQVLFGFGEQAQMGLPASQALQVYGVVAAVGLVELADDAGGQGDH